jgi:hypothetical protein
LERGIVIVSLRHRVRGCWRPHKVFPTRNDLRSRVQVARTGCKPPGLECRACSTVLRARAAARWGPGSARQCREPISPASGCAAAALAALELCFPSPLRRWPHRLAGPGRPAGISGDPGPGRDARAARLPGPAAQAATRGCGGVRAQAGRAGLGATDAAAAAARARPCAVFRRESVGRPAQGRPLKFRSRS